MYKIDREGNKIVKLQECSFEDLGFKEREHLQEWIAKEPTVFGEGEELLIIQKEFSGFSDTRERLDLLALDKRGSLVIIENKLDDTGKDVVWQALKYASYCSSLTKENIRKIYQDFLDKTKSDEKAEEKLSEFFEEDYADLNLNKGVTQRIILIAAKFRKEVTSTVLWLLNFKVRLQCFRATPYSMDDELFLKFEKVIPTQDVEDYMIGMAEKAQDDIVSQTQQSNLEVSRKEFWTKLIDRMNSSKCNLYQNVSPGKYHYISAGSGVRGVGLNFTVTKSYARSELYIDRGSGRENEFIFDHLHKLKDQIEKDYGGPLVWQRLEGIRACRVKDEQPSNVLDADQWDAMINFMADSMTRLDNALEKKLKSVNQKLKAMQQTS